MKARQPAGKREASLRGRLRGRIVLAAGCFNRVHRAHRRMLALARALGDTLVLVLAHDAHNAKPNAVPALKRRRWLAELGAADEIVIGRPGSFVDTLRAIAPAVVALGYDQRLPDEATGRAVAELGIEVVPLPWCPGRDEVLRGKRP